MVAINNITAARANVEGFTVAQVRAAYGKMVEQRSTLGVTVPNTVHTDTTMSILIDGHSRYVGGFMYSGDAWALVGTDEKFVQWANICSTVPGASRDPIKGRVELSTLLGTLPVGSTLLHTCGMEVASSATYLKTKDDTWVCVHAFDERRAKWERASGPFVEEGYTKAIADILGVAPSPTLAKIVDIINEEIYG